MLLRFAGILGWQGLCVAVAVLLADDDSPEEWKVQHITEFIIIFNIPTFFNFSFLLLPFQRHRQRLLASFK